MLFLFSAAAGQDRSGTDLGRADRAEVLFLCSAAEAGQTRDRPGAGQTQSGSDMSYESLPTAFRYSDIRISFLPSGSPVAFPAYAFVFTDFLLFLFSSAAGQGRPGTDLGRADRCRTVFSVLGGGGRTDPVQIKEWPIDRAGAFFVFSSAAGQGRPGTDSGRAERGRAVFFVLVGGGAGQIQVQTRYGAD